MEQQKKKVWATNDASSTEVPEIQDVERPKSLAPPPYSPNAWAELAQILGGWPLGGYFQGHRGDF